MGKARRRIQVSAPSLRPGRLGGGPNAATIDPLFSDYFAYRLSEHVARRCAPKTAERYAELRKYLVRHLGGSRLNELTTAQIQETIHRLQDSGGAVTEEHPGGRPLSAKTVRHLGTLLC